jgi:predicted  nucleic acid-binding Zn-ribbon protein
MAKGDNNPGTLVSGDETGTSDALEALLALQDEDLAAEQLRHRRERLPERSRLAELHRSLTELGTKELGVAQERDRYLAQQRDLETEIAGASARISVIESTLRAGGASSYRDQTAMASEVDALTNRRHQLEDQELEVLGILEPCNAEAERIAASRAEINGAVGEVLVTLGRAEAELDEALASAGIRRTPLAAAVPVPLLKEYESLRARLDGIGAARLVRGTCAGCNLSLSATELDRIRRGGADSIFHCDQCERILVPEHRSGS